MSVPRSKISWTDFSGGDANFVLRGRAAGDCEVSPGCANCYAGAILRRSGLTPEHTTFNPDKLRRLAAKRFESRGDLFRRGFGARPLVFVCDMGDLFHESIDLNIINVAIETFAMREDVDWQVLTKRPARMAELAAKRGQWPGNVWAGTTVENQRMADERIPLLLQVPAKVRFLSCEPLLGPIDIDAAMYPEPRWGMNAFGHTDGFGYEALLQWVIVGGESGPKLRPFDVAWARSLRDQCYTAGVPFFLKQGSALRPGQDDVLDGQTWKQIPSHDA